LHNRRIITAMISISLSVYAFSEFNWNVQNAVANYTLLHPDYAPNSPPKPSRRPDEQMKPALVGYNMPPTDNFSDQATVTSLRSMRQTAGRTNPSVYSLNDTSGKPFQSLPNIKGRVTQTSAYSVGPIAACSSVLQPTLMSSNTQSQASVSPHSSLSKNARLPRFAVNEVRYECSFPFCSVHLCIRYNKIETRCESCIVCIFGNNTEHMLICSMTSTFKTIELLKKSCLTVTKLCGI